LKSLLHLFLKFKVYLLAALKPLGFWGVGAMAALDSSTIPIPMDILVAGYIWEDRHKFLLYCLMAAAGSAIGGLLPFLLGRAGGEIFLLKRINRERYEQLRDRFERQEFLAMMIPSMLPPPTPWKLFVFGAGVFEMKIVNFMLAVFVGRFLRFAIEGALVLKFGPQIVNTVAELAKKHLIALLAGLGVLVAILALYILRKTMRKRSAAEAA
jgi:membrane protein YqaA with SNARE-associated domain